MMAVFWRFAAVWLLLPGLGLPVEPSGAAGVAATTITLAPASPVIAGCAAVDVEIRINDVAGLYGADVWLAFDPAVLEVVDADSSTGGVQITDGGFLAPPLFYLALSADNTAGTMHYAATQLNPTPAVDGSGVLARVKFRAKSAGSSALHFTYTMLSDRNGVQIPAAPVDWSTTTTAPGNSVLAIRALSASTARLSWTAVAGIAKYRLSRDAAPYFAPAEPAYHVTTALSYDDTAALGDPAENHYYVVRSACANGFASTPSNRTGEFDFALVPGV